MSSIPASGEVIARTPLSSKADVDTVVQAAAAAFPAWRRTPAGERIQYLFKLKFLLEEHIDEIVAADHPGKWQNVRRSESRTAARNRKRGSGLRHSDDDAGLQP